MPYATNADLIARYDVRLLGDLSQDANTRASAGTLATDANLIAALTDASGMIESACFVGNKYRATDLSALTGNSQGLLKRLVCDIAFAYLRQRRGYDYEQFPLVKESYKLLDRIRLGERIFDVEAAAEMGNPTSDLITQTTILQQNLASSKCHYFPQRDWISGQ